MNSCIVIGRLTQDIELRYTVEQNPFARFTVAVDRPPKKDGTKETDFIPVVAWGALAENCQKFIGKGSQVAVMGAININREEKENGDKVYFTSIAAQRVKFLDRKKETKNESPSTFPPFDDDDIPF